MPNQNGQKNARAPELSKNHPLSVIVSPKMVLLKKKFLTYYCYRGQKSQAQSLVLKKCFPLPMLSLKNSSKLMCMQLHSHPERPSRVTMPSLLSPPTLLSNDLFLSNLLKLGLIACHFICFTSRDFRFIGLGGWTSSIGDIFKLSK